MTDNKVQIFDTTLRDGEQVPGCKLDTQVAAEALKYAVKPRIHTGIGTSDSHIKYKFKSNREDIIKRAYDAVAYAKTFVEDVKQKVKV